MRASRQQRPGPTRRRIDQADTDHPRKASTSTARADLDAALEIQAPTRFAESWDNVGWQVRGDSDRVTGILCAVDATADVVEEAAQRGANVVLAHHPLLYRPLRTVDTRTRVGRIVSRALLNDVSILTAHTNWDAASGGISWALAQALGLEVKAPLQPRADDAAAGLGVVAEAHQPLSSHALARLVQDRLGTDVALAVGPPREHRRIALMGGSGASAIDAAAASGATLFLTADVRYHEAQEAEALGLSLLVIDHGASERPGMIRLASLLRHHVSVPVLVSELPTSPWRPRY